MLPARQAHPVPGGRAVHRLYYWCAHPGEALDSATEEAVHALKTGWHIQRKWSGRAHRLGDLFDRTNSPRSWLDQLFRGSAKRKRYSRPGASFARRDGAEYAEAAVALALLGWYLMLPPQTD